MKHSLHLKGETMKNLFLAGSLVIVLFFFSGCSFTSDGNNSNQEKAMSAVVEKSDQDQVESSQQNTEQNNFGKEFMPPHFQVEQFQVSTIENNQKMLIQMDYVFDQELFDFIKTENLVFNYSIQYPSQLEENLNLTKSDPIKGEEISELDSQMNYSIEIEEEIPEDYDLSSIVEEPIGFQLTILNKDGEPESLFDDIYQYSIFNSEVE